jgi:hypothetical protein
MRILEKPYSLKIIGFGNDCHSVKIVVNQALLLIKQSLELGYKHLFLVDVAA